MSQGFASSIVAGEEPDSRDEVSSGKATPFSNTSVKNWPTLELNYLFHVT